MRYGRILLVLVCLTLTGAYLSLRAQERREPWPPRPIVPPDSEEQTEPPRKAPKLPPPAPIHFEAPAAKSAGPLPPPAPTPVAPLPTPTATPAPPPPAPIPPAPAPTPVEAPKVDAPKSESPKIDKIELPKVDLPSLPSLPTAIDFPPPTPPSAPSVPATKIETPKTVVAPAKAAELPPAPRVDDLPPPAPTPMATPLTAPVTPAPKGIETPKEPIKGKSSALPLPPPIRHEEDLSPRPIVKTPSREEIKDRAIAAPVAPSPTPPVATAPVKPAPEPLRPFRLLNPQGKTPPPPPVPIPSPAPGSLPALPTPGPEATVAHSSPATTNGAGVVIEKRGPGHVKHTDPIGYVIIVRNPTPSPISHVRIEDEVPASARLLGCEPEPVVQGSRLIWTLASLAPGEEKAFKVNVQASLPGEVNSTARVFLPTAHSFVRTQVHPGAMPAATENALQVQVKAQPSAAPGTNVLFEIYIQNTSAVPVGKMLVQVKMSEGLGHPEGQEIDAELKGVAAGGRESIKLQLKALKAGPQTLDVLIQSIEGHKSADRATVMVGATALRIRPLDTPKVLTRRDAEMGVEVANHLDHPVRNLLVTNSLPDGVDFVSAGDRGVFREENRSVQWLVDFLAPGETRTLRMKVQGRQAGEFKHDMLVRSDAREEAKASGLLRVEAIVDLSMDIANQDKALELGRETLYEILVQNHGTGPATGVRLTAQVPDGMAAQRANGPTAFRVEGRQLIFEPLAQLSPNEKTKYVVGLTGQVAGNQKLRVQLASDQAPTAIAREHTMLVYRDN